MMIVYYPGNRELGLEDLIKEALRSYSGVVVTDFAYDNQVFQAVVKIPSAGQVDNFRQDLNNLGRVFKTKVAIGGYLV